MNFLAGLARPWAIATMGLLGAFIGMLAYVMVISEGASYLSDDPDACINCHIMTPEYATWQRSSHGRDTVCNDCHVPHDSEIRKYWFKAMDGLRHATIFTLNMEPQVMKAREESLHVIQENCVRCHANTLSATMEPLDREGVKLTQVGASAITLPHSDLGRACTDCHREVPHGRVHSLSATPNAAVPPLSPATPDWIRELTRRSER
ncbi:MAG TPA: cytochrome c nitrite reductase small subunit [Deinococcales bacterium]|nr:cytochrome c nitrite reductase small subunit [Deinococcales bacterium]